MGEVIAMEGSYLGEVIAITRTTSREASASKNLLFERALHLFDLGLGLRQRCLYG